MKKLLLVALTVFAGLSFTSCDKDEDGNSLLVGRWKVTSEAWLDHKEVWSTTMVGCDENVIEFKEDGTYHVIDCRAGLFPEQNGRYTTNGIYITLNLDPPQIFLDSSIPEFSYSVTSNTLKLTHTHNGEVGTEEGAYSTVWTFTRM